MNKNFESAIRDTLVSASESIASNTSSRAFLESIFNAARILDESSNRIIVCGMGKSGLIARKVAATLTSTGSPSVYLHPADALHGDIGNLQKKEVVLAFSNSGETREIVELLPHVKRLQGKLIAITQKKDSTLSRESDAVIVYSITKEGCPLELAPMASTTVSLVIGDAIAATLIKIRKFKKEDFGKFHPSGSLGRKLLTRVKDVMKPAKSVLIERSMTFKDLLPKMISANLGCVLIYGSKGHLRGILTDGDIKRVIEQYQNDPLKMLSLSAGEIMTSDPLVVRDSVLVEEAISLMQEKQSYILPVVNTQKKPVGVVRMHDLVAG